MQDMTAVLQASHMSEVLLDDWTCQRRAGVLGNLFTTTRSTAKDAGMSAP